VARAATEVQPRSKAIVGEMARAVEGSKRSYRISEALRSTVAETAET